MRALLGLAAAAALGAEEQADTAAPDQEVMEQPTSATDSAGDEVVEGGGAGTIVTPPVATTPTTETLDNVVWLEVKLSGYEGKKPTIQYAAHDPDRGNALLRDTALRAPLTAVEHRTEHRFVPIWIGYPRTRKFEAHFRLLHEGEVRQLASTDGMRSSEYRFDCDRYGGSSTAEPRMVRAGG